MINENRTANSGEFHPVIPGFFPDPTICRAGEDYFLACSSFEYFPGAPLFHSRDLIHWQQIGNILNRRSQFRRGNGLASNGIYGSTLRYHEGRFWFITTNVSDHHAGQVLVWTDDPFGEWSEPVFIVDATGIDPDLCWDENGTCYLTWNSLDFERGYEGIRQATIDLSTGVLSSDIYPIWQGSGLPAAEGPHLYHIDNCWYLLMAEGGTERGHCITVARGPSPAGPFEACPDNPIFSRRSTFHPVQNVGHADLVQAPDGNWAAVYLGVRPQGSTPGFHVLGRETFLAGIEWQDGWPRFVADHFSFPSIDNSFNETFAELPLDQRWVVPAGEPESICQLAEGGGIRLRGTEPLCTRVRDLRWSAEAVVAGNICFQLRMDDRHWYGLSVDGGIVKAVARIGDVETVIAEHPCEAKKHSLKIESVAPQTPCVPRGHAGPDDIVLSVLMDGIEIELARLDGRYLSTEVSSGFTGRMLGLRSARTGVVVRSLRYVDTQIDI